MLRPTEKGTFMYCWFGEVEGRFPATWSLGNPTRNRCRKAERKSSSVRGVAVTSGDAMLPRAALPDRSGARALSKWQYKPYMFNGNAVEFETFATVRFRLPRKHQ